MSDEAEGELQDDSNDSSNDEATLETGADDQPAESSTDAEPAGDDDNTSLDDEKEKPAGAKVGAPAGSDPKKSSRENILDAVKNLFGTKKKPVGKPGTKAGDDAGAEDDENPDATADGKKAGADQTIPPEVANHPAFKQMQAQYAQVQDAASRHGEFMNFINEHKIQPEEVNNAFTLTALSHRDPEAFFAEITKMRDNWAIFLGKELPADLQAAVDDGEISPEKAKELSAARMEKRQLEVKNKRLETRDTTTQQESDHRTRLDFTGRWMEQKMKADPDLLLKTDAIEGEILRLKERYGAPRNDKEMLTLLNVAHGNVSKRMGGNRRVDPTRPQPKNSGGQQAGQQSVLAKTNPRAAMVKAQLTKMRTG